jgi:hypothetical protein
LNRESFASPNGLDNSFKSGTPITLLLPVLLTDLLLEALSIAFVSVGVTAPLFLPEAGGAEPFGFEIGAEESSGIVVGIEDMFFPPREMGAREEEVETGFEREDGGLDEVVDRRESAGADSRLVEVKEGGKDGQL